MMVGGGEKRKTLKILAHVDATTGHTDSSVTPVEGNPVI